MNTPDDGLCAFVSISYVRLRVTYLPLCVEYLLRHNCCITVVAMYRLRDLCISISCGSRAMRSLLTLFNNSCYLSSLLPSYGSRLYQAFDSVQLLYSCDTALLCISKRWPPRFKLFAVRYTPRQACCVKISGITGWSYQIVMFERTLLIGEFVVFGRGWPVTSLDRQVVPRGYCSLINSTKRTWATSNVARLGTSVFIECVSLMM